MLCEQKPVWSSYALRDIGRTHNLTL